VARIVELAQQPINEENVEALASEFKQLVRTLPRSLTYGRSELSKLEVAAMQQDIRTGLQQLAAGDAWDGPLLRHVLTPTCIYPEGSTRDMLTFAVMELLAPGRGAPRLTRCRGGADGPCKTVIVKRKRAAYCALHGSPALRAKRFRQSHAPQPFEAVTPAPLEFATARPPGDCDFGTWLGFMLSPAPENDAARRAFKKRMAAVLTTRESNLIRAVYGVGQPRVAVPTLAKSLNEKVRAVRQRLQQAEIKLRGTPKVGG
jgi:hypothetical protein